VAGSRVRLDRRHCPLIDEEADDPAALSHTDRELREREAQGDLLDIEMQEAKLI